MKVVGRFLPDEKPSAIVKSAKRFPVTCTTIFAKNRKDFLRAALKARDTGCDLAELRVDHLEDRTASIVSEIVKKSPLPLIVTNRKKKDGGLFREVEETLRISLIESSIECHPAFVDVEFETEESSDLASRARKEKVGVVLSHHDFSGTPPTKRILALTQKMWKEDSDITKLVFRAKDSKDAFRIVDSTQLLNPGKKAYVIFGMGKPGQVTRLASLLLGSCLVYCSLSNNNNLGQIRIQYARKFLGQLERYGISNVRKKRKQIIELLREEMKNQYVNYRSSPLTAINASSFFGRAKHS